MDLGLIETDGLGPTFTDRLAEGFLELFRLEAGMGHYFPTPVSTPGVTPHAYAKAHKGYAEDTQAGAVHKAPILVQMRRRRQIDGIEEKAGLMFATDMAGAFRATGLISAIYAKATRPRGSGMVAPADRMSPEEARSFHYGRFVEACRHVGHLPTIEAVVILVGEYAHSSAADIGRGFIDYKQQQQAQAVGMTLVKVGLQKLARFYGLTT